MMDGYDDDVGDDDGGDGCDDLDGGETDGCDLICACEDGCDCACVWRLADGDFMHEEERGRLEIE